MPPSPVTMVTMIIMAIVFAGFAETCDTAATMDNEQIFHLLQYYNSSMENIFKFRNANNLEQIYANYLPSRLIS